MNPSSLSTGELRSVKLLPKNLDMADTDIRRHTNPAADTTVPIASIPVPTDPIPTAKQVSPINSAGPPTKIGPARVNHCSLAARSPTRGPHLATYGFGRKDTSPAAATYTDSPGQ